MRRGPLVIIISLERLQSCVAPEVPLESQGGVVLPGRLWCGLVVLTSPVLESPPLVLGPGLKHFNISVSRATEYSL